MPYVLNPFTGNFDNIRGESWGDSLYLRLDTTNDPLTGNLELSKADPEIRITDTGDSNYARWHRSDTDGKVFHKNTVFTPGATASISASGSSGNNISLPFNVGSSNDFSFAGWIRPTSLGGLQSIIAQQTTGSFDWNVLFSGTTLYFQVDGGSNISISGQASNNNWLFFGGWYDHSTGNTKLYVNDQTTTGSGATITTNVSLIYLFSRGNGYDRGFSGRMDELAIWVGRKLTDDDFSDMYDSGSGLYLDPGDTFPTSGASIGTSLEGHYHMDDGTSLTDSSGNGNDGTVVAGTFTTADGKINTPGVDKEIAYLTVEDGTTALQEGIITFGHDLARLDIYGDGITLYNASSNTEVVTIGDDEIVINEGGAAFNLRAETDTNENGIKLDTSSEEVGFFTDPTSRFHVDLGTGIFKLGTDASSTFFQADGSANQRILVTPVPTIASSAAADWDSFRINPGTTTITGSTNITSADGFNLVKIDEPVISGNAITITNCATLYIDSAPVVVGPTVTNLDALRVGEGNTRLGGDLVLESNVASDVLIESGNKLGIGTTAVPHGSVGVGMVAIEGANSSSDGPHVQFTTASDDYPLLQILPWRHDNIAIRFDNYFDGSSVRQSDASGFAIQKYSDDLVFWATSNSPGAVSSLVESFRIASNGAILFNSAYADINFQIRSDNSILAHFDAGNDAFCIGDDSVAASNIIMYASGATVFNEQGDAVDFRIEGDTDTQLFMADGGNDAVTVGGNLSTAKFNVNGTTYLADKLIFTQTDGNEYIDSLNDGYIDYGATTGHRFLADVSITKTLPKLSLTDENGDSSYWQRNSSGAVTSLYATVGSTGVVGTALIFDGNSESVNFGDVLDVGTGDFTIIGWYRTTDTGSAMALVEKWNGNGYSLCLNRNGSLGVTNGDIFFSVANTYDSISVGTSVYDGNWHSIAVTRSGATAEIFFDGVSQGTISVGSGDADNSGSLRFGTASGGTGLDFAGTMDMWGIYTRVLTDDEITDFHNSGDGLYLDTSNNWPSTGTSMSDSVGGIWRFNDGTGTTLTDSSGNGYDGTLTNIDSATDWVTGKVATSAGDVTREFIRIEDAAGTSEEGATTFGHESARLSLEGNEIYINVGSGQDNYVALTSRLIEFNPDSADMDVAFNGDTVSDLLFLNGGNDTVSIGTDTLKNGTGRLGIYGTDASTTAGPHTHWLTSADDHPLLSVFAYQHDNVSLLFDAYHDGSNVVASDASQFRWIKTGDVLELHCGSTAAGSTVSWSDVLYITDTGSITWNRQGNQVNFTCESDSYSRMFQVNGIDNAVYIGTGTEAAIAKFDNDGVVFNEEGGARSLRVETDTMTHMLFVDGANDRVYIGGATEVGADISFRNDGTAIFNIQGNDADFNICKQGGTQGFTLDAANGRIGINNPVPGSTLDIESTEKLSLELRYTGTGTNAIDIISALRAKTSNGMSDGFGPGMLYTIEDDASGEQSIAYIAGVRDGADSSGALDFYTYSSGSASRRMRIGADGGIHVGGIKSGATQGAAGAAAGELWKTSSHASLPDNVIMIGV